jgi:hypothetical protein
MAHVIFPFYFTIRLAAWYTLCKPSQKLVIILLFTPEHALQTCASHLQSTKQTCSMVHAMQTSTEARYPYPIHTRACSANLRILFAIYKTNMQHGACYANLHRSLVSFSYSHQNMLCKPAHPICNSQNKRAAWCMLCKPSQKLGIIIVFIPEHALQTCAFPFAIHKTNMQHGACFANPHRSLASFFFVYQIMLCKP